MRSTDLNKHPKKVAIVGGGAAGLLAAITAAEAEHTVTLFEKTDRVGKKILASGNGRCNISNAALHVSHYFGEEHSFVHEALLQFDFHHFKKFCRHIGLFLEIKPDGRIYPLSNEAKSVQLLLETHAKAVGVEILLNHHIQSIRKSDEAFSLTCNNENFDGFDALIITTGSEAALQLGGSSDGYNFAQSFGHEIIPTYPSLVQLHLDSDIPSKMAGVKVQGSVTLYINREQHDTIEGDLLFTRYGISGFAILDISQGASKALLEYQQVSISLNLLPQFNVQQLASMINKLTVSMPDRTVSSLLSGLISSKIVPYILLTCKIDPLSLCRFISSKQIKSIVHNMTQWRFDVSDTHGFKHAEVSGGGISTQMINSKTMESQLVKNLYFAGEVLDIVGKRGGYNLHFAWASGYLAAKSL
jgi:predicted Rossmann fold flavoprotein